MCRLRSVGCCEVLISVNMYDLLSCVVTIGVGAVVFGIGSCVGLSGFCVAGASTFLFLSWKWGGDLLSTCLRFSF